MMRLSKLKRRFFSKKIEFDIASDDLALLLQLGWVEYYMGAYMLTERGVAEMAYYMRKNKDQYVS